MSKDSSVSDKLVNALLAEQKSARRWRNARFFIWIAIIIIIFLFMVGPVFNKYLAEDTLRDKPYASLIQLDGEIMPNQEFSADRVIPLLNKAFEDKKAKGVVLLINSPGGSAVQASIIHDKIEQLKKKYKKRVVVVAGDVLASGAYLIATAADKIYVNPNTLTGSIGVIMSGFGFTDAIKKLGITRRVFTAGDNKDRLDPFEPLTESDKIKIQHILNLAHQNFINDVLMGRKGKLHGERKELFSGDFWLGQTAVKLGLADGTANLWTVLEKEFNVKHYKRYSVRSTIFEIITRNVRTELHLGLPNHALTILALARKP